MFFRILVGLVRKKNLNDLTLINTAKFLTGKRFQTFKSKHPHLHIHFRLKCIYSVRLFALFYSIFYVQMFWKVVTQEVARCYYLEKVFLTNLANFPGKHVYLKTCRIGTSTVIWKSPSQAFAMNSAKFFRTAKHFFLEECYSFQWASIFLIFSDLNLNIFLKYSYINFTINCIRKSSHQKKSHFRQNKHIERS